MLRNIITVLTIIMASPAATQELQPIELKDGANAYESKAIASAMSERDFRYIQILCRRKPFYPWPTLCGQNR